MGRIEESSVIVDGVEIFCRRVAGHGTPAVLLHGVPTSSQDYVPLLEQIEGPALAYDLPGMGRSERPPHLYAMSGYASFHEHVLAELGIERHRLVVHDWGVIGLIAAQRNPGLVERLVVVNAVPLLEGYRWHPIARLWRTRGVGEVLNASWNRPAGSLVLRLARGDRGKPPREFVDMVFDHLDPGAKRQILCLYRSAPEPALAAAGARLGEIDCPALVLWGTRDPYIPARFGAAWRDALPRAELEELEGLGHWPWHEDPAVTGRMAGFLAA